MHYIPKSEVLADVINPFGAPWHRRAKRVRRWKGAQGRRP